MRIIILSMGIIMILMNKAIAAFLAPILVILVATAVIVLIVLAIIGHLLGTIVQRFNRIHKK